MTWHKVFSNPRKKTVYAWDWPLVVRKDGTATLDGIEFESETAARSAALGWMHAEMEEEHENGRCRRGCFFCKAEKEGWSLVGKW